MGRKYYEEDAVQLEILQMALPRMSRVESIELIEAYEYEKENTFAVMYTEEEFMPSSNYF